MLSWRCNLSIFQFVHMVLMGEGLFSFLKLFFENYIIKAVLQKQNGLYIKFVLATRYYIIPGIPPPIGIAGSALFTSLIAMMKNMKIIHLIQKSQ